jgi:hypothetical protein
MMRWQDREDRPLHIQRCTGRIRRIGNEKTIDARGIVTIPLPSGCRKTSRTWPRNSGRSSRQRTPRWARDTSAGSGTRPSTDQPRIRDGVMGARHGRIVTHAVRSPARPATRWMRVVSLASSRVIAGRMVVSRRASMDVPASAGPMKSTVWAQRLHRVHLRSHGLVCRAPMTVRCRGKAWGGHACAPRSVRGLC